MTDPDNRIRIHEGSITLPAGFEDRTTNVFVPADPANQPNLSVARDWLKDGETLAPYVDRQLALLKSRLQGHKLIARQAERLGPDDRALAGERIDASYRNGARLVYQRQAAFIVAPGRVLIFTASGTRTFNDEMDALWRGWLDDYRPADETGETGETGEPRPA
ncbi:DUF1795 domain-containing protein [Burkholderia stagnalis]|uniref:DUF1795 domain-containing protein n=1 Tax=Burkholderia stagnalis TaxID=1503054 RepID=UPI00075DC8E0|nr:DUF1795 domain-containing protein [Burkholderia stagnalis]AOK57430.1 hypothetical protein WT74_22285 [Burkholderia stagnalis]KVN68668.1 hypothetical protein WT15_32840 [Burkholderia stagnalis]KVX65965.1 hypothetical protein WT33_09100 [Burkholderia stagnalis]KWO27562.1 hypothetical protein WT95_22405 [Burkholderia stagnalis]KWO36130.1 hypothetical protein WT96_15780 [Burkholderia stagnalis]